MARRDTSSRVRRALPSLFAGLAAAALANGCGGCSASEEAASVASSTSSGPGGGGPTLPPSSPKAQVRFKNGARLQRDLSRALAIEPQQLCKELGLYECFGIHRVVLGDADAFGVGLYEPLPATNATTPLAVDRIVLTACAQRAKLDLDSPASAVIYQGLVLQGGKLAVQDASVSAAIDRLYRRALARNAKESEIAHHRQLYLDIEQKALDTTPVRHWATLSCYAVLTSMEMLFY
jgi:hypothetical protein